MIFRHRLAALSNARHERCALSKGHAAQATTEHTARRAMTFDIAVTTECKLHGFAAARRQTAKHIAAVGTRGHLADQLRHVGRA